MFLRSDVGERVYALSKTLATALLMVFKAKKI